MPLKFGMKLPYNIKFPDYVEDNDMDLDLADETSSHGKLFIYCCRVSEDDYLEFSQVLSKQCIFV